MAIIAGKEPKPEQTSYSPRVIVKLAQGEAGKSGKAAFASTAQDAIRRVVPSAKVAPMSSDVSKLSRGARAVLEGYVAVEVADKKKAGELVRTLSRMPEVAAAYVEGGPTPPPVNPGDDPRSGDQGYLDAAPNGIDARWAWDVTDGGGIGFVDLEQGWVLDHEDLDDAGITIISGVSNAYHGHGTAVLGEVVAVDNARGGVGIAPECSARVVSQWRTSSTYSTAEAILSAADNMDPGDVLLLEAQTTVGSSSYLPVEVETAAFDAIRHATDEGIVVVEAAGNGANDLDNYMDGAGKNILDRGSADFQDSGAIMVGAASSAAPHTRLGFSNFGSRIDCYGWGQNIDTTGDGWTGMATDTYTSNFGGTSGASPIITGAALLLQSWAKQAYSAPFLPPSVRALLSDPATGTPSADPAADMIGVMPSLRQVIQAQMLQDRLREINRRYASFVHILIGVIDDSPGFIWVPGKGPVPVDPDWGFRIQRISPAKKDLLAALISNEIASRVGDRATRKLLENASVKAMERSVKNMMR